MSALPVFVSGYYNYYGLLFENLKEFVHFRSAC